MRGAAGWLCVWLSTDIPSTLPPPLFCSAAPSSGYHLRPPSGGSVAGSSAGRNGLLSQQMAEAPAGPPSASGSGTISAAPSAPLYINGHGPRGGGGGGSAYGGEHSGGGRGSGAVTPEDAPGTRNGSKPASPKALEAQVAKLVQGQQQLSNQLEELALQISLSQSGLGVVVPTAQQKALAAAAAAAEAQPGGLLQHLRALVCSSAAGGAAVDSSVPPAAWAAAGAVAGAAATAALLLLGSRR